MGLPTESSRNKGRESAIETLIDMDEAGVAYRVSRTMVSSLFLFRVCCFVGDDGLNFIVTRLSWERLVSLMSLRLSPSIVPSFSIVALC